MRGSLLLAGRQVQRKCSLSKALSHATCDTYLLLAICFPSCNDAPHSILTFGSLCEYMVHLRDKWFRNAPSAPSAPIDPCNRRMRLATPPDKCRRHSAHVTECRRACGAHRARLPRACQGQIHFPEDCFFSVRRCRSESCSSIGPAHGDRRMPNGIGPSVGMLGGALASVGDVPAPLLPLSTAYRSPCAFNVKVLQQLQ